MQVDGHQHQHITENQKGIKNKLEKTGNLSNCILEYL